MPATKLKKMVGGTRLTIWVHFGSLWWILKLARVTLLNKQRRVLVCLFGCWTLLARCCLNVCNRPQPPAAVRSHPPPSATGIYGRGHGESLKECHYWILLRVLKCHFAWQAWRLVTLRGDGQRQVQYCQYLIIFMSTLFFVACFCRSFFHGRTKESRSANYAAGAVFGAASAVLGTVLLLWCSMRFIQSSHSTHSKRPAHYTPQFPQFTLHAAHSGFYTLHWNPAPRFQTPKHHPPHFTHYTPHCQLYTLHSQLYISPCTLHLYTLHIPQALHAENSTLHTPNPFVGAPVFARCFSRGTGLHMHAWRWSPHCCHGTWP